jgi:hypothetical protein
MLEIIKGRTADGDYEFTISPCNSVFIGEACNPVYRAEAFSPVFKAEAGNMDIDNNILTVELEHPPVPVPRIALVLDDEGKRVVDRAIVSEKAYEQIMKLIEEPANPSQQLIDLLNRKPRYEKRY